MVIQVCQRNHNLSKWYI